MKRRNKSLRDEEKKVGYLLNIPALVIISLTVIYPIIYSFFISLHYWNLKRPHLMRFIGFKNYVSFFSQPSFWQTMKTTIIFVSGTVVLVIVLGLLVAIVLNEKFRGRGLIRALILIPWAIPEVASGIIWKWMLDPSYGVINAILKNLGMIDHYVAFLSYPMTAMISVILANVWKQLPLTAILLLAGLQTIPIELYEVARVDGANIFQRFTKITLPLLKSSLLVVIIFETMFAFRTFDLIYVLTAGGPANATRVIGWFIYIITFRFLDFGRGSALGYILAIILLGLAFLYLKVLSHRD